MLNTKVRLVAAKQNTDDITEDELAAAPDGFFEEITALSTIEQSKNDNIVEFLCSKLRSGGKLILRGVDGHELARNIFHANTTLASLTPLIQSVNRLTSVVELKELFVGKQWQFHFVALHGSNYHVEAVKP